MRFLPTGVVALITAALTAPAGAQPVVVDGRFDEWPASAVRLDDPRGDASGATDVLSLSGRRDSEYLYLRLRVAEPMNLQKPGEGGGLRIEVRGEHETVAIETDRRLVERDGQPVPFPDVGYIALPTHAATEFEIRLRAPDGDLAVSVDGSDSLDGELMLGPSDDAVPVREIEVARGDTPLRVVSWNVLYGGPFGDPEREADGREVLRLLDPDVLLLQEVWDISEFEQRVRDLCGEAWKVSEMGGVAVASRWPLTPLELDPPVELDDRRRPLGGDSWSVMRNLFVGVDTPVGPVVMVSAHWKCCGHGGSEEDIQRMDDALVALKAIWRLRDAGVPARPRRDGSMPHKSVVPERFTDAPIIIAGDYNMVGSRAPLDMLLTQGFTELIPIQSDEWSAATWRPQSDARIEMGTPADDGWQPGGFPQGRLDLAVVDPRLGVSRAFVADLGEPTLVSDHLPIVIDFGGEPVR